MDILHECKYSAVFAHFTITIVFFVAQIPPQLPLPVAGISTPFLHVVLGPSESDTVSRTVIPQTKIKQERRWHLQSLFVNAMRPNS